MTENAVGDISSHPYADKWQEPNNNNNNNNNGNKASELKVYNTLTRSKVPFRPRDGNTVRWYNCGPTVYDSSHIGHARNYVTFDILRRILEDYFGFDVTLVMNITDIDDKIIIRARQAHLVEQYRLQNGTVQQEMLVELAKMLDGFLNDKLNVANEDAWTKLTDFMQSKAAASEDIDAKQTMHFNTASKAKTILSKMEVGSNSKDLIDAFQDILAIELDAKFGATVTDQKIFRDLAAYWEGEFLADMKALNVRPVSLMTRVTEFVPQVVDYVQQIIKNGYAYEAQGSVYFDVTAFHEQKGHLYAKLCPWSAGNCKFFEEGEGALGVKLGGKKDPRDFALWKASKAGEPSWDSPWGAGRPGWHIECSAMAAAVTPGTLDIHSGGIDLAFPHHDNELAQSEAFYESTQWVNYFMHAGHVHIEGHKMSKSLKNFITIRDALARYSSRQLRIMFLQHQWHAPVYYKESSMTTAVAVETLFTNFLTTMSAIVRSTGNVAPECFVEEKELGLLKTLSEAQNKIHSSLCDNFDTPAVLLQLQELVTATNIYIKQKDSPNVYVLKMIGKYVTKMLRIFGVITESSTFSNDENDSMRLEATGNSSTSSESMNSILELVAGYRDKIRSLALEKSLDSKELLKVSDQLRDQLTDFGVLFEDRPGKSTLVKLVDKDTIATMKAEQDARETEKLARKLEMARINEAKQAQKLAKAAIEPSKLFINDPTFGKFDERGIPTHDKEGVELGKNARKKVVKEFEAQLELYQKFIDGKL